jgi:FkbM family methyltransferase
MLESPEITQRSARVVINVVYERLFWNEIHSLHRGELQVVWTPHPMTDADIYAYFSPSSFRGKTKGFDVLLLLESITALPGAYDENVWRCFDHVLSLCDAATEISDRASQVYHPRSHWIHSSPITENINERKTKYPLQGRQRGLCMINGCKKSSAPFELYSSRERVARWFHEHSSLPFDVYGNPPFPLPNCKGILAPDGKLGTLSWYTYSLCFENTDHPAFSAGYISEKILDCLETRTIPVYRGCANISTRIPKECYIHFPDYPSLSDLEDYLRTMTLDDYLGYISAIDNWVAGGGLRPYSWLAIYEKLFALWKAREGGNGLCEFGEARWTAGLAKDDAALQVTQIQSPRIWDFKELADTPSSFPGIQVEGRAHDRSDFSPETSLGEPEIEDPYEEVKKSLRIGRMDEAEEGMRLILTQEPHHVRSLNDLGVICSQRGDRAAAFTHFQDAAQSDKTDRIAIHNLIGSLIQMGRPDDAIATLKSALESDGGKDFVDIGAFYLDVLTNEKENPPPLFHHSTIEYPGNAVAKIMNSCEPALTLKWIKSPSHSLTAEFLGELARIFRADVFVETGTFMGGTTLEASQIFSSVHTIELSKELYLQAQPRFAGRDNIHTYQGDSGTLLPEILNTIEGKIVFWLDGHYSEGVTAKSEKNSPILEELRAIKNANIPDAVILIDDLRMFPNSWTRIPDIASLQDYPTIPQLLNAIRDISSSYSFIVLGDVIIAYPPGETVIVSPVVAACTLSRLFEGNETDVMNVMDAERIVGAVSGEEHAVIQNLFALLSPAVAGLGEHYRLWYALSLMQQQQYAQACEQLQITVEGGFTHWRIHWYHAQAAYQSGNIALARRHLNKVLEDAPDFRDAQNLRENMDMQNQDVHKYNDIMTRLRSSGAWCDGQPLRLHLGCGENHFAGYVNIDFPPTEHTVQTRVAADLFADLTLLDFPDDTVDEIRLHHVFEHFGRSQALALLIRWHGWLKVGGRLHIETPDVMGCAKALLTGISYKTKQAFLRHAFGSHEAIWAYHYDGWYEEKFQHVLAKLGFDVQCRLSHWRNDPKLTNVEAIATKTVHVNRDDLLNAADAILLDSMVADVPGEQAMHRVWCDMLRNELERVHQRDTSVPVLREEIVGISIKTDSPAFDGIGYNNDDIMKNGEFHVLSKMVKKGDVIFDVGANKGKWSNLILEMNPDVKIHAFEPVPETFVILGNSIKSRNAALHNLAISNEDKEKTFYHWANSSESGELSSLYRRPEVEQRMNISVKPISVQSRTLDSFCKENHIHRIHFLKIDTEGAELDVLNGASQLLESKSISTLQFEYGGTYHDSGITLKQIYELLRQKGYHVFRIIQEGLLHVPCWRDALENYQYANYIATIAQPKEPGKKAPAHGVIQDRSMDRGKVAIIFSKDRAMQLDGSLRSFFLHCKDHQGTHLKVLYTTSSELHERQYTALREEYCDVQFICEKQFKEDLLTALSPYDYALFLVDDNIFAGDLSINEATAALAEADNALGISLRLGRNTTFSYMPGKQQPLPVFEQRRSGLLSFDWTSAELDFGYPLELSSSIYRTADLLPLFKDWDFTNPNTLELQMDLHKSVFQNSRNALLCFPVSRCFCNPVNMVQTVWANRAGNTGAYTSEKLRELFGRGLRIDVRRFSDYVSTSCHEEVDFAFIPNESVQEGVRPTDGTGKAPFVTIGILNWNGIQHIQLCLESIRRNTPEPHEIIVVDNGSTDGSREYLKDQKDIILILNPENVGDHGARNQFMAISRGDYIVFLDNDTIVTKDWIKKFIAHMESDPQIGIIGACSNYASGLQGIPGVRYSTIDEIEAYADRRAKEHHGELVRSPRLITFCVCIRKAAAEKIGAMETGFSKTGFSDDDYSLRIAISGFKSVVANDVFIHHTGGPTGRGDQQYGQWNRDAWEGFKRKWGLPQGMPYESGYNAEMLASQPFDPKKHFIPHYDPGSVEPLIWRATSVFDNPPLCQAEPVKETPPLIHPEFIEGMTTIIIPVQSIHLNECVSAIKKCTAEPHEIIFLDHGSAPKVKKQISAAVKENHNYKVIKIDRKDHFTRSINEGINQSTGEFIVLLFDDVVVCEGWLSDMLACLHSGKDIGVVGAMSDDASSLQRVTGMDFTSTEKRLSFRERNRHRRIQSRNLDGFCMLFRRDLLIQIGLFDEILCQDTHVFDDFCVRAVLEGYRNVIAGNVFVHNGGGINRLLSRDKTLFDEKWIGLDASTPLAEKVLTANAMETARSQYHKGVIDDAVKTLILRIGFSPDEKRLFYRLAELLLAEHRFQDALDALKGMSAAKEDADYHALLGYGNEGLGFYQVAEECADRALSIDYKSAPALNLKGILAYRKSDMDKAEEWFCLAIETDPGYGDPYANMGMLRWKTDQTEEAVNLFEKGFILSSDQGDLITGYYQAIQSLERYGRAEIVFREAREAYPENKRILFLLIDLLLKQDKFQEAMNEVEKAMVHFGMDEGILTAALAIRRKIGAKSIAAKDKKAKSAPTLSVCMIVKNEERHLAYCLNSLSPVADEMIVVDTGSTDKTKQIAEAFGAQVHDFEWTNDFAVARNHSLSKAHGDWILVMDADEVISPLDYAKLKKLIFKKDKTAYNFITRNYVARTAGDGWVSNDNTYIHEQAGRGWYPSAKVRLFPNNEKIRFEQPIHELVEYSLQRMGFTRQESVIPIHHYGELDAKKATIKDAQYYELGLQKMRESGGDFRSVWELAVQAAELGKTEESIELWHKVLGFKEREAAAYFNLANHYLHLRKYEESYACSRKSYALDPQDQSAVLSYAMSEFLAGDIHKTISALERFLKGTDSQTSLVGLLAVSYLISGEKARGLKYLRGLVKKKYDCVYYLKDLSQSLIAAGNLTRAKSLLAAAIEIKFYDQETTALLARCNGGAGK